MLKRISYWALLNPRKTWAILALAHALLGACLIGLGLWLFVEDVFVPEYVFQTGVVLFFSALVLYPIRRARYSFWKYNYVRQKTLDSALLLSTALIVIPLANWDAHTVWRFQEPAYRAQHTMMDLSQGKEVQKTEKSLRHFRKEMRVRYKSFLSEMKSRGNASDDGGKIAGIILLMILLMLAIAILACVAGCSDMGGLAAFIWIFGWGLVLYLGIRGIRRIKGRRKADYQPLPK